MLLFSFCFLKFADIYLWYISDFSSLFWPLCSLFSSCGSLTLPLVPSYTLLSFIRYFPVFPNIIRTYRVQYDPRLKSPVINLYIYVHIYTHRKNIIYVLYIYDKWFRFSYPMLWVANPYFHLAFLRFLHFFLSFPSCLMEVLTIY